MFGNLGNSQQGNGGITGPTNNNPVINNDIPSAVDPSIQSNQQVGDPNSVFPASNSDDPFGTTVSAVPPTDNQNNNNDLISLKQQALQELSPLVKHLNQDPEEKFKTTMMMIQASDEQSLIPEAFEAAKNIKEDKARAQALLDIINEINYFTQDSTNS